MVAQERDLAARTDQPAVESTVEIYVSRLQELADRLEAEGNFELAQRVRSWPVERPSDRQLLFVRPLEGSNDLDKSETASDFMSLRRSRAAELFERAKALANEGEVVRAYQLLFEVEREDPKHAAATKILGKRSRAIKVAAGKTRNDELKWKAGSYWRAHSDHFTVITNHSEQAAHAMAQRLELLHQVWKQLFVRHWTTDRSIQRAFAGKSLNWPTRRRHNVVLFDQRSKFIKHLKPVEPQIDMALGVYRDKVRTTYFYEGESDLQSTWLHEATHQLFQETVPSRPGAGTNFDYWMLEAVAMYLESAKFHGDYATVGGADATRLEIARHRVLEENFYVPLHVISELGKNDMQRHSDIRKLYTQSAGLAHFLMDGSEGAYRDGFIKAVSDLYRRPGITDPLWKRLRLSSSTLDDAYQAFLRGAMLQANAACE